MNIFFRWIIFALAILIAAYLLPGIHISGFASALILALVLGLINALLRPILVILTLPVTILTLGLFLLVINALLVLLADSMVRGFAVDSFWWAAAFSIIVSIVGSLLKGAVKISK